MAQEIPPTGTGRITGRVLTSRMERPPAAACCQAVGRTHAGAAFEQPADRIRTPGPYRVEQGGIPPYAFLWHGGVQGGAGEARHDARRARPDGRPRLGNES